MRLTWIGKESYWIPTVGQVWEGKEFDAEDAAGQDLVERGLAAPVPGVAEDVTDGDWSTWASRDQQAE